MNKLHYTLALLGATTALMLSSCKGSKDTSSTPETRGEVRIVEYCSGPEFLTNGEYFRASATGTSPQREIAKKIALLIFGDLSCNMLNTSSKIRDEKLLNF